MNAVIRFGTLAASLVLAGCLSSPVQMGSQEAKTTATGAAGGATSSGANSQLERCDRPLGTLALLEDQNSDWYRILTGEYRLTSTVPLLRLLVQQSNCFVVVERGRGFQQMTTERALEQSGELRKNSNFGKGQMVSADYGLTPTVIFSARDTGGMGGALGGVSHRLGVIGAIGAGVKQREASTMLTLVDNRSGVQVSASEGSASKTDFSILGGLIGTHAGGGMGGYSNTPEGKVIAAAFTDAYNQMVKVLRNYKPQEATGPRGLGTGGSLGVAGDNPPGAPAAAPTKKKR
ncbi:MAG TPA: CsgG/HfaB family protein [Rhodocyclaceae bacterium]|nr:peptidoglycan-binding protein [Rhodocyclaceae bacterium]HMV53934.1 CsgG/HfaB family protein [Rhodocyclaceae bacterium]HMZ84459.1 CsgG/HfaB family protein [Rhodocyclaceae bacterium]HNA04041.1 CsgG/HfaB family protein [Rhodocyclaceae bacterium]HNB79672.1 CsgG/HfaB family protein [Rhodocyclaceae bacterium]